MNEPKAERKTQSVASRGIRAIEPITGIHVDTIMRLGVRVGQACAKIQDEKISRSKTPDGI
jgi:hypothetical protein